MMTQTHLLVAATLFCSPSRPTRQNAAVLLGAMAPDAAIYALFIWSKLAGIPEQRLWDEIYFTEPMPTFTAIGNSAPLYIAIALIGLLIAKSAASADETTGGWSYHITPPHTHVLILFGLAALTHLAGDLPVHNSDAHPHFWPLTDWRFISPVSYWDGDHHGGIFSAVEAIFGIALAAIIFRRLKTLWVRLLTTLLIVAYIAVPLYFTVILGGGG